MKNFHSVFAIGLLLCLGSIARQSAAAQTGPVVQSTATANSPRIRKDWDDLTDPEKQAFTHAVDVLKKKSQKNIYDRTGFLWQAWIHNCSTVPVPDGRMVDGKLVSMGDTNFKKLLENDTFDSCDPRNFVSMRDGIGMHNESPGECEHRKDIFLQWHRAELWFFEQALRAADPDGKEGGPSTRDVTLPYWNFTRKPTGKRYPKEFEDPTSPLFDITRNQDLLPSSLPTASPWLLAYLIHNEDKWADFGGDMPPGVGQGDLETKIHNRMHGAYIGGHMGDNTKAAMDPLFYVFHNFLDFSLDAWIEEHKAAAIPAGSPRADYLRAQQDGGFAKPPGFNPGQSDVPNSKWGNYIVNMGQAELYLDTVSLGYTFRNPETKFPDEIIPKEKIHDLIAAHEAVGFGNSSMSLMSTLLSYGSGQPAANPNVKLFGKYTIPAQPIAPEKNTVRLRFTRAQVQFDYDFCADVYLYPEGIHEDIGNAEFRNRWLVATTAHWGLKHGQHDSGIMLNEDVTSIVNSLVPGKSKETWAILLAVSNCGKGTLPDEKDFSKPYFMLEPK